VSSYFAVHYRFINLQPIQLKFVTAPDSLIASVPLALLPLRPRQRRACALRLVPAVCVVPVRAPHRTARWARPNRARGAGQPRSANGIIVSPSPTEKA